MPFARMEHAGGRCHTSNMADNRRFEEKSRKNRCCKCGFDVFPAAQELPTHSTITPDKSEHNGTARYINCEKLILSFSPLTMRLYRETRMRSLSHSHRRSGGARKRRRAAAKVERVRTGLYVPLACEHPLGTLVRFSFCIFAALLCSSRGSNHSYPDMLS